MIIKWTERLVPWHRSNIIPAFDEFRLCSVAAPVKSVDLGPAHGRRLSFGCERGIWMLNRCFGLDFAVLLRFESVEVGNSERRC
jgi:hypothetical protein